MSIIPLTLPFISPYLVQTYLEQNQGPGVQHLALKTNDIFHTLREMQARSDFGGFEFMPRPKPEYYRKLPSRIGDVLTPEQYKVGSTCRCTTTG
jgi:4-hydroxyphenylpyruvate dioxygenase